MSVLGGSAAFQSYSRSVVVHDARRRRINNLCRPTIGCSRRSRHDRGAEIVSADTIASPSRKRERSSTIAGSHAAFLPSTKPKGANKELRTRAATSYKKRRGHFSRGRLNKTRRPRRACNAMTRGNSTSEIFPENFRRVTLAYFGGSDSFASGFAAVWDLTNPTARHADGINRIDVARIRPILGYYVSTLAVTFYLAAAFLAANVASVQNLRDITIG